MNAPIACGYEADLAGWIDSQIALLRAREFDQLDIDNLIEELDASAACLRSRPVWPRKFPNISSRVIRIRLQQPPEKPACPRTAFPVYYPHTVEQLPDTEFLP